MSIPRVYLIEMDEAQQKVTSFIPSVFSSRWKAIAHFTRIHPSAEFNQDNDIIRVTVDGTTVGWITKKIVQ